jgi:23S rRNA (uridine2552-2'-O)-methyltransferase
MADYKKPDYWQLKARKDGYPARSVYKLQEMDERFGLLKPAHSARILDLGAAPGSWSLYILREWGSGTGDQGGNRASLMRRPSVSVGDRGLGTGDRGSGTGDGGTPRRLLVAADISPLSRQYDHGLFDGGNFRFIQGDITDPAVRDSVFSLGPYSLIISDAAPATTGNRLIDTVRSLELAETVIFSADNALAENGGLVVKVFQGGDSAGLLKRMRVLFKTAKSYKPQSCRRESFEAYYIGTGKKPG